VCRPSYRRKCQIKSTCDRLWAGFFHDGDPCRFIHTLTDEEQPVLDRQGFPYIYDIRIVEIKVYAFFLLDDLRDRINKKNEDARAGQSVTVLSKAVVVTRWRDLLFPIKSPYPHKHGAPVRCFRKEPTPEMWTIILICLLVSCNLPWFQLACNL